MKKLCSIFLTSVLFLSLAACTVQDNPPHKETNTDNPSQNETNANETNADNSAQNDSEPVAEKPKEETFGLNETVIFDNIKVTAVDLDETKGESYNTADDGKTFVGVKFEIENVSEETQSISTMLLFTPYADDIKCDESFFGESAFGDDSLGGELSPGKKMVGWYAVEISEDWKKLELEVKSDWLSDNKAKFVFEK